MVKPICEFGNDAATPGNGKQQDVPPRRRFRDRLYFQGIPRAGWLPGHRAARLPAQGDGAAPADKGAGRPAGDGGSAQAARRGGQDAGGEAAAVGPAYLAACSAIRLDISWARSRTFT